MGGTWAGGVGKRDVLRVGPLRDCSKVKETFSDDLMIPLSPLPCCG